jgi:putative ABC transport system substrate-binding protein
MRRRDFIAALGSAAAWPLPALGQQAVKKATHIGLLFPQSQATADPRQMQAFRAGLAENGLVEGQNIALDVRWAGGNVERARCTP